MYTGHQSCEAGCDVKPSNRFDAFEPHESTAPRDPALATDGLDAPGTVVRQVVHPWEVYSVFPWTCCGALVFLPNVSNASARLAEHLNRFRLIWNVYSVFRGARCDALVKRLN